MMCLVVAGVSTLIHLYSVAYMGGDRGYSRFFAYLNFFVFSMLLLVLAANFFLLIVGWAFVGAASYFLISFWYRRKTATDAGIKAFVINVAGDVGLVLGTYFVFQGTGTLDFLRTFEEVDAGVFSTNDPELVAGCLLLLVGAFAKSAQVPLHTWLPDAMEGPTPVSALIHAATMVTAGVYLIARLHPLFEHAPDAAAVGAIVGAATLFIAATIGLVVTDLKRVIAYSTMSQIGYMIMAVCSAAYAAGMFHLMTHAFFKALLFMAAGSVIAAMGGTQDLDRMGGFRKVMPFTFACMVIGGLALSGIPPFSGFFSKDEILSLEFERARLVRGARRDRLPRRVHDRRLHVPDDLPGVLRRDGSGGRGALARPPLPRSRADESGDRRGRGHRRRLPGPRAPHRRARGADEGRDGHARAAGDRRRLPADPGRHERAAPLPRADVRRLGALRGARADVRHRNGSGSAIGALLGVAGIALAWRLWGNDRQPDAIRERFSGLHRFFVNKWYFDEAIDFLIVRPTAWLGRFANSTFERVFVNGALVGGTTGAVRTLSTAVRGIQSGYLRYYAALLLIGLTGLGAYFLISA